MKFYTHTVYTFLSLSALTLSACSSGPLSGEDIAATGPTVVNARSEPGTIELNRDLQPIQDPKVVADVKDFKSEVTEVTLRFENVPITIPMENIGGTVWEARLDPRQLQMMAVSGQTVRYDAQVIAKNDDGQVSTSSEPVEVAVKTPDLAESASG